MERLRCLRRLPGPGGPRRAGLYRAPPGGAGGRHCAGCTALSAARRMKLPVPCSAGECSVRAVDPWEHAVPGQAKATGRSQYFRHGPPYCSWTGSRRRAGRSGRSRIPRRVQPGLAVADVRAWSPGQGPADRGVAGCPRGRASGRRPASLSVAWRARGSVPRSIMDWREIAGDDAAAHPVDRASRRSGAMRSRRTAQQEALRGLTLDQVQASRQGAAVLSSALDRRPPADQPGAVVVEDRVPGPAFLLRPRRRGIAGGDVRISPASGSRSARLPRRTGVPRPAVRG